MRSVQVLAAGKPVNDWTGLFRAMDFKGATSGSNFLNQNVLAAGARFDWIAFPDAATFDKFQDDWARFHVVARICYSSTLGEDWMVLYGADVSALRPRAISHCPNVPYSQQFHR
ncbi:MAG: hypothetical protein ACREP0_09380 [Rhodanobacteraceae bacterium]